MASTSAVKSSGINASFTGDCSEWKRPIRDEFFRPQPQEFVTPVGKSESASKYSVIPAIKIKTHGH
jgi:hypothetical protein